MPKSILKGTIGSATHTVKYDDEGIEYWLHAITVDQARYTSRSPRGIYLSSGSPIVFEAEDGTITAAWCPREDFGWGRNLRALKRQVDVSEKFEFVEGVVVEKRERITLNADFSRDALQRESGVGYTVVLEDRTFHATSQFGAPLRAGMPISAVLQQNDAALVRINSTGKIIGLPRRTYIIWILAIIAFNAMMYFLYTTGRSASLNFNSVLVVINVFMVLFTLLSIAAHVQENEVKKFYYQNVGGRHPSGG